jgi:hypothetical protein
LHIQSVRLDIIISRDETISFNRNLLIDQFRIKLRKGISNMQNNFNSLKNNETITRNNNLSGILSHNEYYCSSVQGLHILYCNP